MRTNLHVRASADQYDRFVASGIQPWDLLLIQRIRAEMRRQAKGGRLVDIGAGTGVLLSRIALMPDFDDLELVATDFFPTMIDAAMKRLAISQQLGRIRVEQQDVHSLTYPNYYARYVISRSTLHHWADPVTALREIHRILEPQGVALIHDVRRDAPADIIMRLNEKRAASGIGPMLLDEKFTADEVRRYCVQAGLGRCAHVRTGASGPAALGFELRIQRGTSICQRPIEG